MELRCGASFMGPVQEGSRTSIACRGVELFSVTVSPRASCSGDKNISDVVLSKMFSRSEVGKVITGIGNWLW